MIDRLIDQCPRDPALATSPLHRWPPHAHISRIHVFIFDDKAGYALGRGYVVIDWVTSQMLRPFLLYSLCIKQNTNVG